MTPILKGFRKNTILLFIVVLYGQGLANDNDLKWDLEQTYTYLFRICQQQTILVSFCVIIEYLFIEIHIAMFKRNLLPCMKLQ